MAEENGNESENGAGEAEASGNGSNGSNVGKVEQVTGVVVDVAFPEELPEIYSALTVAMDAGKEDRDEDEATELVLEVQQHLGDDRVKCVAMDSTDGLRRG